MPSRRLAPPDPVLFLSLAFGQVLLGVGLWRDHETIIGYLPYEEGPMGPRIAQPRHFAERASTVLYALVRAGLVIALILAALFLVVLVIRAALHG